MLSANEATPGAAFLTDANGQISSWNATCERLFGFTAAAVLHQPLLGLLAPSSHPGFDQLWAELTSHRRGRLRVDIRRADASVGASHLLVFPQFDGEGAFQGCVTFFSDELEDSEAAKVGRTPLRAIVNMFPGAFYVINEAGRFVLWNKNLEQVLEMPPAELAAVRAPDLFEEPYKSLIVQKIGEVFDGVEVLVEAELVTRSGRHRTQLFSGTRIDTIDARYLCGVGLDISERRAQEEQLRLRERALHAANNGIVITRCAGRDNPIVYVNPAFERITGYRADEVIGRDARFMAAPGLDVNERVQLRDAIREQRELNVVFRNQRKDGVLFWNDLTITPVHGPEDGVTHFIGIINDVTAARQRTAHLEHEVNHDALTGLANRNLLWDRLEQALHMAQRNKLLVATILIDLNNFKLVNDSFGHEAGDEVLRAVAKRLEASVRDSDTVARLSGDEFVLVLVNQPSVRYTLRMIDRVSKRMSQPVNFNGREIPVSGSMGVSVYPHDGATVMELVRAADVAMYHAKGNRKEHVHFFSADMKSTTEAKQKLEDEMHEALERNELFLLYQPKVNLASGRIEGIEALLRWRHPEHGILAPDSFLAEAEENGMIVPIGNWVLDQACAFLQQLKQLGFTDLPVAVNASYKEYSQNDFIGHIGDRLQRLDVAPANLELELRQDGLIRNPDLGREIAARIDRLGMKLAVDEFGDGLSDLGYLRNLNIAHLKIAKAVVHEICAESPGGAMAKTLIDIGRNLNIAVVGEGVETLAQRDFLKANGCDAMQGIYFSEPVGTDALWEMLAASRPPAAA